MDENGKKNGYVPKDSYAEKKEDARRTDAGEAADAAAQEKQADGFCDNPYGDPAAEAPKPRPQLNIYGQPIQTPSSDGADGGAMPPVTEAPEAPRGNGMAITSMVLGIISLLFTCCCGIGVLPAFVGIVLAVVDISKRGKANGYAVAGLILGILGVVLSLAMLIGSAILFSDPAFTESLHTEI